MRTGSGPLIGSESDGSLWRRAVAGDEQAFGALYERHACKIYNYLFRRLADWSEAEDLTAVTFVEALRRRKDAVVVEDRVLPWLYGIATNVYRNARRTQWRHRRLLGELARERSSGQPLPPERIEAREEMRALLRRLAQLPRPQQDVIALCLWSGLTYEEASVALGIPIGTVRSRLARGRAALMELEDAPGHRQVGKHERTAER